MASSASPSWPRSIRSAPARHLYPPLCRSRRPEPGWKALECSGSASAESEHGLSVHLAPEQVGDGSPYGAKIAPVDDAVEADVEVAGGHQIGEVAEVGRRRARAPQLGEDHEGVEARPGLAVEGGGIERRR